MRSAKILAFVGVIGYAMAAQGTIKQKLAQKGATLAQAEV